MLMWLRTGTNSGLCEQGNETLVSVKGGDFLE
jgi:hypothetical protein